MQHRPKLTVVVVHPWKKSFAAVLRGAHATGHPCWLWGRTGGNSVFSPSLPLRYRFKGTFLSRERVNCKKSPPPSLLSGLYVVCRHRTQIGCQLNQGPLNQARFVRGSGVALLRNISSLFLFKRLQKQEGGKKKTRAADVPLVGLGCSAAEVASGHTSGTHGCSSWFPLTQRNSDRATELLQEDTDQEPSALLGQHLETQPEWHSEPLLMDPESSLYILL